MHQLDDKKSDVSGRSRMTSQPISHMDTLPWTPFAAMKAQQQISAATKISPVVHETGSRGILGYDSVKSVSFAFHYWDISSFSFNSFL